MKASSIGRLAWIAAAVAVAAVTLAVPAWAEIVKQEGSLITVRQQGEAVLGEGTKKAVKENAKLTAIRTAIEAHVGVNIVSQSTMKNFQMESDVVSSYQRAYVKSVVEISYEYNPANETGIYLGEFTIDTAAMAKMAEAEKQLSANKDTPVEASVFLFDGEGRMMAEGGSVHEGDKFNVMVQPVGDLYAYIISRDTQGNLFNIFPNPDLSPHSNPLQAGIQYYFPPKESDIIFAFDGNRGQERFYFLFSAVEMKDIDDLFSQLSTMGSGGNNAVGQILEERVASRGEAAQSAATEADIAAKGMSSHRQVGELLKGTGAFVKTISLRHD